MKEREEMGRKGEMVGKIGKERRRWQRKGRIWKKG